MIAHLVKLETAPDLVEQVYRALLDAISDGSLTRSTPPRKTRWSNRARTCIGGICAA